MTTAMTLRKILGFWQGAAVYKIAMHRGHSTPDGTVSGFSNPAFSSEETSEGQTANGAMGMKWSALHDAAGVVATLAGIAPGQIDPAWQDFPAQVQASPAWRRKLAEQGIDDLSAIMEAGISALLAVNARGSDSHPAARSLWNEYVSACNGLLALVPPELEKPSRH